MATDQAAFNAAMIRSGQQKQIVKNAEIAALFARYGVEVQGGGS